MRKIILPLIFIVVLNIVHSQPDEILAYGDPGWRLQTIPPNIFTDTPLLDDFYFRNLDWSEEQQAFVATSLGNQIHYLDPVNSETNRLTDEDMDKIIFNEHPKWSPDGEKIAFLSNGQLHIMDSNGSNPMQLVESNYNDGQFGLTWLFNGSHIAFVRSISSEGTWDDEGIYIVDVANGEVTRLTDRETLCVGWTHDLDWSAASGQLAILADCTFGETFEIYTVPATTLEELNDFNYQIITKDFFEWSNFRQLSWSPSGSHIAFTAFINDDTPGSEIIVLDVERTLASETPVYEQMTDNSVSLRNQYHGLTWVTLDNPDD